MRFVLKSFVHDTHPFHFSNILSLLQNIQNAVAGWSHEPPWAKPMFRMIPKTSEMGCSINLLLDWQYVLQSFSVI